MKFLITLSAFFVFNLSLFAQLPRKVQKIEGLWGYRQGSGFEKWKVQGDAIVGESFRVNKIGDKLIER